MDPFTIDRTGAPTRAAEVSLPVAFRIEPPVLGVGCPQWRLMTLVRASPDTTWRLVRSTETDSAGEVILYGTPGQTTLVVVECPGRPGYSLHGPRVWGRRRAVETMQLRRRRTVRVSLGRSSNRSVRMVLPQQYEGTSWPKCDLIPPGQAECLGVPYEATGVVVSEGGAGLSWGGATPRATTVQTVSSVAARWGRLIYFTDAASGTSDDLRVTSWRQDRRPPSSSRHRVRVVSDSQTDVHQIGPRSFWVVGRTDTNDRFLEVKGARATTVRIDSKTLIGAAADRPLRVFLRPPVPVAGLIVDTGGAPVEGALVSLFELIRSRPHTGKARGDEIVTKR